MGGSGGWGLSDDALAAVCAAILSRGIKRVVEFGSGERSTRALITIGVEFDSFDHTEQYKGKDLISRIKIRPLGEDGFYTFQPGDLSGKYGLMILDGPNGPTRSVAFGVIKPFLDPGALILIDDWNHFKFVEACAEVFRFKELLRSKAHDDPFLLLEVEDD